MRHAMSYAGLFVNAVSDLCARKMTQSYCKTHLQWLWGVPRVLARVAMGLARQ
ncbi:MAG: hypothetical protein ACJASV_001723 [Pseudorhodobacter sp.]|jgi:hypothetical protein